MGCEAGPGAHHNAARSQEGLLVHIFIDFKWKVRGEYLEMMSRIFLAWPSQWFVLAAEKSLMSKWEPQRCESCENLMILPSSCWDVGRSGWGTFPFTIQVNIKCSPAYWQPARISITDSTFYFAITYLPATRWCCGRRPSQNRLSFATSLFFGIFTEQQVLHHKRITWITSN